jgi:hypothetical protein
MEGQLQMFGNMINLYDSYKIYDCVTVDLDGIPKELLDQGCPTQVGLWAAEQKSKEKCSKF